LTNQVKPSICFYCCLFSGSPPTRLCRFTLTGGIYKHPSSALPQKLPLRYGLLAMAFHPSEESWRAVPSLSMRERCSNLSTLSPSLFSSPPSLSYIKPSSLSSPSSLFLFNLTLFFPDMPSQHHYSPAHLYHHTSPRTIT